MTVTKYKLFKNVYLRQVDPNYYGIYNPLYKQTILFLPKDAAEELLELKHPGEMKPNVVKYSKLLLENKILVLEDFDSNIPIKNAGKLITENLKFSLMYLVITEECNLRCSYCFVEGNIQHKPRFMNIETCDRAINLFEKVVNKTGDQRVRFYGGEPLLNFAVLDYSVKKLRKLEKKGKFSNLEIALATNGTKITEDLAKFCKEYNLNVSISLDGPEEIHNAVRKSIGGRGSYTEVIKGYRLLREQGLYPAISCTITKQNVKCLENVVSFFLNELDVKGLGFNFLLDLKGRENPEQIPIEKAASSLLKVFEILRAKGIYEDRIMRRLNKIIDNKIHLKDCAGYGHQIVVGPTGDVGPCHIFMSAGDYIAGNVYDKDFNLLESQVFKEFNRRSPFNMKECEDCSFITICGGGCAFEPFNKKGTIWTKDERACAQCNSLIDWIIDDLWRKKSGAESNI